MKLDKVETFELLPRFAKGAAISKAVCGVVDRLFDDSDTDQGLSTRIHSLPCATHEDIARLNSFELREMVETVGAFGWYPFTELSKTLERNAKNMSIVLDHATTAITGKSVEPFVENMLADRAAISDGSQNFSYKIEIDGIHEGDEAYFGRILYGIKQNTRATCFLEHVTNNAEGSGSRTYALVGGDVCQYINTHQICD